MAGVSEYFQPPSLVTFCTATIALALLAATIGHVTDELSQRLPPIATGIVQSALGNLPELFVSIFGLRAGLIELVQSSLVGSILANGLLVLGSAMLAGGLKHGAQKFHADQPRTITTLFFFGVAALIVPSLATQIHSSVSRHIQSLSVAIALMLLAVFVGSMTYALQSHARQQPLEQRESWPLRTIIFVLLLTSVLAAFVSDWFIASTSATIVKLHISQSFTGFVIVALAANTVEHAVGIQLALRAQPDYALAIILNSLLQIALALIPALVILSVFLSPTPFNLVLSPLLVVALALAAVLDIVIVFDGEYNWLEGLALIGLYGIFGALFWWS
ncbi:MAG: sodium:proton exchanger [Chloroflexi bacterium]|nr:sodium:proton exchanger [Chloroflexota bacterium]